MLTVNKHIYTYIWECKIKTKLLQAQLTFLRQAARPTLQTLTKKKLPLHIYAWWMLNKHLFQKLKLTEKYEFNHLINIIILPINKWGSHLEYLTKMKVKYGITVCI